MAPMIDSPSPVPGDVRASSSRVNRLKAWGRKPVREPGSLVEHVELQPPGILDSEQRDRPGAVAERVLDGVRERLLEIGRIAHQPAVRDVLDLDRASVPLRRGLEPGRHRGEQ
jgi:hypothetical protein